MERGGCVYFMTNKADTVIYVGVTSELRSRVWEHKHKIYSNSFTAKYNCNKLVYYRFFSDIEEAIDEEKRIKGGSRKNKIALIESMNPEWNDLYDHLE